MNYIGFYINLDQCADRRSEIEAQLPRFNVQSLYKRFPAAKGNILGFPNPHLTDGEIGCFISHYLLLKQNAESTVPLHIVEDDVLFSSATKDMILSVIASKMLNSYDILFTDTIVDLDNFSLGKYKKIFDESVDRDDKGRVKVVRYRLTNYMACTSSYIVNPNSIPKLIDIFGQVLAKGTKVNIDVVIRQKVQEGVIRAKCLFPFVTSVRLDRIIKNTIIRRIPDARSVLAHNIARQSFFVDCEMKELRQFAESIFAKPEGIDLHHQLLTQLLSFSMTKDYRRF